MIAYLVTNIINGKRYIGISSKSAQKHRARIGAANTGRTVSAAPRAKISAANKARSPEMQAKLAEAGRIAGEKRRGVPLSQEHRARIGAANKGRQYSEETRSRMVAGQLRRQAAHRPDHAPRASPRPA
jgi:hypothetical protein